MAAFMSEADIRRTLAHTRTSQEVKQQLIEAGLSTLPPIVLNLARLLAKKGRSALAAAIAAEYHRLAEQQKGVARARATTAVPLTELERNALVGAIHQGTGREVVLETEVDPALLGGVVVQIGDRLVDASTRARLHALRESLVGAVG
jgi:F-type H+-transporting ATPase subunit delta